MAEELVRDVDTLTENISTIYDRWKDIEAGVDVTCPSSGLFAELRRNGSRGRPKYIISREQLLFLHDLRLTWTKIAAMYGVSRRTMYNIRSELGLTQIECPRFYYSYSYTNNKAIPTTRLRDCLSEALRWTLDTTY